MTATEAGPAADRRAHRQRSPRLVERGPVLEELGAIFSQSLAVPSRCIAVEGPWGSGRTAVLNAAADLAGRAECLVLRAAGGPLEQSIPFAVLQRLLASAAARADGSEHLRDQATCLESLVAGTDGERPDPIRVSAGFHRLILGLRDLAPVLLVVDDADLADPETLAALQYLVRGLGHQQIWLVVSARPLHRGVGIRPVDGLLTEPDVRQLVLEPLGPAGVSAMLAGFFESAPDPHFAAACHAATGGSPFLLKALLPSLRRAGVAPTAAMADRVEQVRAPKVIQAVLSRLAPLPAAVTDLLRACAVLGEAADPGMARTLAALDAADADRAVDAAEQMELLGPDRPVTFTSPLVRWSIYHDIPTDRRSALHSRAARLEGQAGGDDAVVARHLLATEPGSDPDAAALLQQLGRSALEGGHVELAVACLDRALTEAPPGDHRADLHLDLAGAELTRDPRSAVGHLRRALDRGGTDPARTVRLGVDLLDRVAGRPELRAQATSLLRGWQGQREGTARPLEVELEVALTLTADRPADRTGGVERLRIMVRRPGGGESGPADRLARTVLAVEEVLTSTTIPAEEAAAVLGRTAGIEHPVDAGPMAARVRARALFGLLCADRFASVDQCIGGESGVAVDGGARVLGQHRVSELNGLSLLWQGELIRAEDAYRHGRASDPAPAGEPVPPSIGSIDTLIEQGRIDDALHLVESTDPAAIDDPLFRWVALVERGRLLVARDHLEEGVDQLVTAGDQASAAGVRNPAIVPWRAPAVMALAALGEWAEAGRLAEENLGLARAFGAARATGTALRAMAAASPDPVQRARWLADALAVLEPSEARLDTAHALVEIGRVLVARGDKEEARRALRRGATLASGCGAHQLIEIAGELLRAAGARPRRLGAVGPESLTPAELRVVELAAGGMTNQRIADALYVTLKTVEGHLAKAYRKLGVESRRDLPGALAGHADGRPPDGTTGGDHTDLVTLTPRAG